MRELFVPKNFKEETLEVIDQANEIIEEYLAQGYDLTLRQIFYQFVSRDMIPNTQRDYKRLGTIISDGRLAGLIDWQSIVDRLRKVETLPSWGTPQDIVKSCINQFRVDMWKNQSVRVEVWIEKDALVGVIESVCQKNRVSYLACRGYVSQSAMYEAAMRIRRHRDIDRQETIILHLGDHDPSGMDMTRDVTHRLWLLSGQDVDVRRLALNKDQINEYDPPPNPTKLTDSRSQEYVSNYGEDSWELDALEPSVITNLINEEIMTLREDARWVENTERETAGQANLRNIVMNWYQVIRFLEESE